MSNQGKAYLYALASVICWATVASAFKLTLRSVDFLALLFYSSLTSTVFLFLVLLFQGKLPSLFASRDGGAGGGRSGASNGAGDERRFHSSGIKWSIAAGFINPFLYYSVLFKAYSILPAQEAQPLNYTWPVVLSILAVKVLHERVRARHILGLLVSFFGVVVISTHGNVTGFRFENPLGDGLAIGSSIIWAAFWLINAKDARDPVVKLFLSFLFGFFFVAVTTFLLSSIDANPLVGSMINALGSRGAIAVGGFPPEVDAAGLLGCIYVGLFEMGLVFFLWNRAMDLSEVTAKVSGLIYMSPFISLIFIRFVVGEVILRSSIVGLAFIVLGVLVQGRR